MNFGQKKSFFVPLAAGPFFEQVLQGSVIVSFPQLCMGAGSGGCREAEHHLIVGSLGTGALVIHTLPP